MRRWILGAVTALALLALAASPAGADVPQGQGLISFGTVSCEGIGDVDVFGPSGEGASTSFTTSGQHVAIQTFTQTFVDTEGTVFFFSKTFGVKSGLTTFTCTQHVEVPGLGTSDITAVVALVPPG
jgi:hypothetical protein